MHEIETTWASAKRKSTGAEFSLTTTPPEFSDEQGLYNNPTLGLRIGFAAIWVCEKRRLEKDGKVHQAELYLGVILREGQLRERIQEAAGQRLSKTEIENTLVDCYELIVAFMRGWDERRYKLGVVPHVYEVPHRRFNALSSPSVGVSPDAVQASGATLIL